MLTPPADLDPAILVRELAHWGLRETELAYLPVGFGSHHWRADNPDGSRAFVTVDDLHAGWFDDDAGSAFDSLERTCRTAAALRNGAGLEFVLASLPDGQGALCRRLGEHYALSVLPFVDGTSGPFGRFETDDERRRIAHLVGRLHAAREAVLAGLPRRDDLAIPSRSVLGDALDDLARPWETGPFGEPTRRLLAARADALHRSLRSHDARASRVRGRSDAWVVTHGEPHRGNVIVDAHDAWHLVDWDTTLVAPRERDLWWILDEDQTGWEEYTRAAGDVALDADALELYRQRWDLADIAAFVALFRRPHEEDENTTASFGHLTGYLGG